MNHILTRIYTAHYRYSGPTRIDITVKGKDPNWHHFAPTWSMVMGTKNGTMTEEQYITQYLNILKSIPTHVWDSLLQMEEVTFVCFCQKDAFCHRNILTNFILKSLGDRVTYCGWRVA